MVLKNQVLYIGIQGCGYEKYGFIDPTYYVASNVLIIYH